MKSKNIENLYSWLQYFDIEYLDTETAEKLSELDVNDCDQQVKAIETAILHEFAALNEISKQSLKRILAECKECSEKELAPIFKRVGMPFNNPIVKRQEFLQTIWRVIFE